MDPAVKARWVAALRSGEYAQGRSALRTAVDKYCCLGVLCELAVEAGVIPPAVPSGPVGNPGGVGFSVYRYGETAGAGPASKYYESQYPPYVVAVWAGVNRYGDRHWSETDDKAPESLVSLNDTGVTFDEIADIIEAEF